MILRVWRGWTVADRADAYEALLRETVFPSILARDMPGFRRIALYRRPLDAEVEFMTVMAFDSAEAVAAFMGKADTAAYVPDEARRLLLRFEAHAAHFEQREVRQAALPAPPLS